MSFVMNVRFLIQRELLLILMTAPAVERVSLIFMPTEIFRQKLAKYVINRRFAQKPGNRFSNETVVRFICLPSIESSKLQNPDTSKNGLACISHQIPTVAPQSSMSAALRSVGLLDILSSMPCGALRRAPCIHARLRRLATEHGEKCRLDCRILKNISRSLRGAYKSFTYPEKPSFVLQSSKM